MGVDAFVTLLNKRLLLLLLGFFTFCVSDLVQVEATEYRESVVSEK